MAQMLPMYSTKNFCDIYPDVTTFMRDYGALGLPKTISDQNAQILFYLLFSRYGNSPIANYDENQFKGCENISIIIVWKHFRCISIGI